MLQWMRGCTFLFNVLTVMLQWVKEGVVGGGAGRRKVTASPTVIIACVI